MFYMTSILGNYDVTALFKVTDDICVFFSVNDTNFPLYRNFRFIGISRRRAIHPILQISPTSKGQGDLNRLSMVASPERNKVVSRCL